MIKKIINWFTRQDLKDEIILLQEELKLFRTTNELDNLVLEAYKKLTTKLQLQLLELTNTEFKEKPINWTEIQGDTITTKHKVFGSTLPIPIDVRDLFNSTYLTRGLAKRIIKLHKLKPTSTFYKIVLSCQNFLNPYIKYESNMLMYGIIDMWDNGDLAIVKQTGDCDLTSRVFIRVLNDVLDILDKKELKKYNFQVIGMVTFDTEQFGHSWVEVYNPEDKKWYLIETTEDVQYSELRQLEKNYIKEFSNNIYKVYKQKEIYERFL